MLTKVQTRELIDDLFEQEALAIGGMVAAQGMEDDLVWRLVRNLDVIRRKALRRLEDEDPEMEGTEPEPTPHPAIRDFLLLLRRA